MTEAAQTKAKSKGILFYIYTIENGAIIGIDFGTTYSSCAYAHKDEESGEVISLISYNDGHNTVPSHVYYNAKSSEVVIGNSVRFNYRAVGHSAYDSHRLIGRTFDDKCIEEDRKRWIFKVVEDEGLPKVELPYNNTTAKISGFEIGSQILKLIKKKADDNLKHNYALPTKAVVSVPVSFTQKQRKDIIKSVELANLKLVKLLNDTTAAAIYGYVYESTKYVDVLRGDRKYFIYDFGGGKISISIAKLNTEKKEIEILNTNGNGHLGGIDIDERLMTYYLNKYNIRTGKTRDKIQVTKLLSLLKECERVKCELAIQSVVARSVPSSPVIRLDGKSPNNNLNNMNNSIRRNSTKDPNGNSLVNVKSDLLADVDIDTSLSAPEFNELNKEIFSKTIEILDRMFKEINMKPREVTDVLLVGGSSRIAKIQQLLKMKFPTADFSYELNPEEIVNKGLIMYTKQNEYGFTYQEKLYTLISRKALVHDIDVNSKSSSNSFRLLKLISKNTVVPCEFKETIKNENENEKMMVIELYEGEGEKSTVANEMKLNDNCKLIDRYGIELETPNKVGEIEVELTYKVDSNNILSLEAVMKKGAATKKVELKSI